MPYRNLRLQTPREAQSSAERYAEQMRVGFDALRFESGLEAEYRNALMAEALRPAYVLNLATAIVWGGFAIFDFLRLDLSARWPLAPDIWLLLGARWIVLAILILGLFPRLTRHMPLDVRAFATYLMLGLSGVLTAALYRLNGLQSIETMQVIIIMSAFVPMGLRFYGSLLASFAIVAFAIVLGTLMLPPASNASQMAVVAVMLLSVPVAGLGGYLREHAHRRQFLLAALLAHQAQFDSLTNLANRRLFERHAEAAIAHANRTSEPITMAVIDIDHFKHFNDRYGHAAGDEALRRVAETIADCARRPMDMAARLGGEEFAVLLFGTDLPKAEPLLETIRQRVGELDIAGRRLTISIGAAELGADGLDGLYRRADRLLYRSKDAGRNRVTVDLYSIPSARSA